MEKQTLILKQVELYWAFLGHPNTNGDYASGKYEVTLHLTPEQAKAVRDKGLSAKQTMKPIEGTDKVRLVLKSERAPIVGNKDGIQMTPEELDKIGNGSIANILINFFEVRGQLFAGIGKIRMSKIVEYTAKGSFDDLADDDYQSPVADLVDDDDDI